MGLPQGSRGSEGVIACICFWLLLAGQAFGLVVSDDPSLHVVTPPSEFDRVGYISTSGGTTGVLIGPWQGLTAKHCVSYNGVPYGSGTFSLDLPSGRHTYSWTSANVSLHSTVDLAVITLDPNNYVGLPGYKLYTLLDEVAQTGILVGYGMSGTPATVGAGGDPNYPRGTKRFGYNQIDSIGGSFIKTIKMDFDDPATVGQPGGSLGADKEVMVADGDSGGSVFIKQNGILKVAGINSTIGYKDSTHWPRYGDSCSSIKFPSVNGRYKP